MVGVMLGSRKPLNRSHIPGTLATAPSGIDCSAQASTSGTRPMSGARACSSTVQPPRARSVRLLWVQRWCVKACRRAGVRACRRRAHVRACGPHGARHCTHTHTRTHTHTTPSRRHGRHGRRRSPHGAITPTAPGGAHHRRSLWAVVAMLPRCHAGQTTKRPRSGRCG
jgi:hypothetical protein